MGQPTAKDYGLASVGASCQFGSPVGGAAGARIAATSSAQLACRNALDTALAKFSVATATAATDAVPLAQLQATVGLVVAIPFTFADFPGDVDSTQTIPAGAVFLQAFVHVDTAFDNTPLIAVGQVGSTSLLMGTGDSDLTLAGVPNNQGGSMFTAVFLPNGVVRLTLSEGVHPTAGAGIVYVQFAIPLA